MASFDDTEWNINTAWGRLHSSPAELSRLGGLTFPVDGMLVWLLATVRGGGGAENLDSTSLFLPAGRTR